VIQRRFVQLFGKLVEFAYARGDEFSFGDAWAKDGHVSHSLHYERLAIDVNLFINGVWIQAAEPEWYVLGAYWKGLDPLCRWGGDIPGKVDLNHFSMAPAIGDRRI
jgi:hypothetical protein